MYWIQRGSLQPYLFSCSPGGNAQSFLGLSSGRRRASHGSVFHFRAPGQDVSFPDGITDDGVFHGDHEGHRGSLLLSRGAGQAGPLPKSPLLRSPKSGPGHGEEGPLTLPTGELAAGGPEGLVSLCMHHILSSKRSHLPISVTNGRVFNNICPMPPHNSPFTCRAGQAQKSYWDCLW